MVAPSPSHSTARSAVAGARSPASGRLRRRTRGAPHGRGGVFLPALAARVPDADGVIEHLGREHEEPDVQMAKTTKQAARVSQEGTRGVGTRLRAARSGGAHRRAPRRRGRAGAAADRAVRHGGVRRARRAGREGDPARCTGRVQRPVRPLGRRRARARASRAPRRQRVVRCAVLPAQARPVRVRRASSVPVWRDLRSRRRRSARAACVARCAGLA